MPNINQLNSVDTPSGSDLLPIYSQANGDARKISLTNFLNWIQNNISFPNSNPAPQLQTQYATPSSSGSTVQVTDSSASTWLIATPTAAFAALTIKLPAVGNCIDKQEVLVNCTKQVTTLTVDGNGAGAVTGEPASLGADDFFRLRFDILTHSWYRVG
jgi:hypothetical protein